MHQLKVAVLFVLILAVMRLVSWSLLWLLGRLFKSGPVPPRLVSNVVALLAFAGVLIVDSVPGELLDIQALVFGAIAFGVFFVLDTRWLPKCLLRRIQGSRPA